MNKNLSSDPSLRSLVRRIRIHTDQVKAVLARFEQWMAGARHGVQVSALIVGDSGVGKTEIARAICEKYASSRDSDGRTSPVVFVQTPDSPSGIALIEAILEALGDPRPGSGTKTAKRRRLLKMFRDQGVLFVILDDIQQLIDPSREWLSYDASECLKTILKMSSTSFIGFGLPQATLLTKLNEQWERLNQGTIVVERFDWNSEASKCQLQSVLKTFQQKLPMFELPDLASEGMALRFYLATGGLIDYIAKILLQATWNAIDKDKAVIGTKDLQQAMETAICSSEPLGFSPFVMAIKDGQDLSMELARARRIVSHKDRQGPTRSKHRSRLVALALK